MTTLPHKDEDNGYRLRIGKKLPKEAANLAYVHTDNPTPEKNLLIQDYSNLISENQEIKDNESEKVFVNLDGYLYSKKEKYISKRSEILLTNLTSSDETKEPLYFATSSKQFVNLENWRVIPIDTFLNKGKENNIQNLNKWEKILVSVKNERIRISHKDGSELNQNEKFEIYLELQTDQEGEFIYQINIASNQEGLEETYVIHYPAWIGGKSIIKEEVLNLTPVSNRKKSLNQDKIEYETIPVTNGYEVKTNVKSLGVPIRHTHLGAYSFSYQLETDLEAKFSENNSHTINIGLVYLNENVHNAVKTTTALKRLVYKNPLMPNYLNFKNPHPEYGYSDKKQDSNYWLANLQMPTEKYLDYDILILSGYGKKDFTSVNHSIEMFLQAGGTILLDNCGTGLGVIDSSPNGKQTLPVDVSFSKSKNELGKRIFTEKAVMRDRYFLVTNTEKIGQASPAIMLSGKENISDWNVFINHQSGGPSLLEKKSNWSGRFLVSNAALMLDVLFGKEETMKFMTNFILYISENRSFRTPLLLEEVKHRENLYKSEYKDINNKVLYVEDSSDGDQTQIVAKKILAEKSKDLILKYLPNAYKNSFIKSVKTIIHDSGKIDLENTDMEQESLDENKSFEISKENALPGWNFVKFSGGASIGEHNKLIARTGKKSILIKTTNAQAFFEKNVGILPSGSYELEVFVKSEGTQGGGAGVYDIDGTLISKSKEVIGTNNWTRLLVTFFLEEKRHVYIRLGSHGSESNSFIYFDDLSLKSSGVIRMTPENNGNIPLYAYALVPQSVNPREVNSFATENAMMEGSFVDDDLSGVLTIRSFVYQWYSKESLFKKEYGNQTNLPFNVKISEGEKVISKMNNLLPPISSGIEWSKKDNVYYEVFIMTTPDSEKIDLRIFDPTINRYFYRPDGQWVVNHQDLYYDGLNSTLQIRVKAISGAVIPKEKPLFVKELGQQAISVSYPSTLDENQRWYLRVLNGSFMKKKVSAKEIREISTLGRSDYYNRFISGTHRYEIPEFERQSFFPSKGLRYVQNETVEYINRKVLKVQKTPLVLDDDRIVNETLWAIDSSNKVFKGSFDHWSKSKQPVIKWDELGNNSWTNLTIPFDIDYEAGQVVLERALPKGKISANYVYDTFQLRKRLHSSKRVKNEKLTTTDKRTFHSKNRNWSITPDLVLYSNNIPIHPESYTIDYLTGSVRFFQDQNKSVYADYGYFEEKEIPITGVNRKTGEVFLENEVSFKDEIYATYLIKENHYEYKGYFDNEQNVFIHLDLNPTTGHTFTSKVETDGKIEYKEMPTEKLLGKEIYLYLLPYKSLYHNIEKTNHTTVKHVLSKEEWEMIKKTNPEALLLARIQVRANTSPEQAIVMDARKPGGGLKEHISQEEIESKIGYTSAFWDIGSFDGMPFYKGGVTIIEIPETVLIENGGTFTEADVTEIVEKYLSYGIYSIIEYV